MRRLTEWLSTLSSAGESAWGLVRDDEPATPPELKLVTNNGGATYHSEQTIFDVSDGADVTIEMGGQICHLRGPGQVVWRSK